MLLQAWESAWLAAAGMASPTAGTKLCKTACHTGSGFLHVMQWKVTGAMRQAQPAPCSTSRAAARLLLYARLRAPRPAAPSPPGAAPLPSSRSASSSSDAEVLPSLSLPESLP